LFYDAFVWWCVVCCCCGWYFLGKVFWLMVLVGFLFCLEVCFVVYIFMGDGGWGLFFGEWGVVLFAFKLFVSSALRLLNVDLDSSSVGRGMLSNSKSGFSWSWKSYGSSSEEIGRFLVLLRFFERFVMESWVFTRWIGGGFMGDCVVWVGLFVILWWEGGGCWCSYEVGWFCFGFLTWRFGPCGIHYILWWVFLA
jgi:hypothetical protein